jgi:hypothetical protein
MAGSRSARYNTHFQINLEMKRKSLAACTPPDSEVLALQKIVDANRDVIRWLESL